MKSFSTLAGILDTYIGQLIPGWSTNYEPCLCYAHILTQASGSRLPTRDQSWRGSTVLRHLLLIQASLIATDPISCLVASISLYSSNDGWLSQRHSTQQLIPGHFHTSTTTDESDQGSAPNEDGMHMRCDVGSTPRVGLTS